MKESENLSSRTQARAAEQLRATAACPVSIICTTFNHELYIEKALDGFLAQRTDFPFEIVIHDDASTDRTRTIIEGYVAAHPLVIRPIFQEVNQYSQGGFKPIVFAAGHAEGKYLALCEGDDYWISGTKLQQQYESLEARPDLDFCFHSAFNLRNDKRDKRPSWVYDDKRVLSNRDILESGDGTFAPTSAYMIRKEVLGLLPAWFFERAPVGDFFIEMYAARRGGALYIDAPMSVYRTMSDGSWHLNTYGNDIAFQKYLSSMLEALSLMEPDFPGLYKSFRWKRAWLYTFGALHYLRREKHAEFRELIELALTETGFISKKQAVAYLLRRWPEAANQVIAALFNIRRLVSGSPAK